MSKSIEAKIREEALRLLEEAGPEGMKTSEIVKDIHSKVEDKSKTAKWVWWKMHDKTHKDKITKIKHGLYRLSKFDDINSREVNDGDRPLQKNDKGTNNKSRVIAENDIDTCYVICEEDFKGTPDIKNI